MSGAVFSADSVVGGFSPEGLRDFLESGFEIVGADVSGADLEEVVVELFEDEPAGFFEAGFDVDGSDDGFEDIAEDSWSGSSAG